MDINENPTSGPARGTAEAHSHLSAGSEPSRTDELQARAKDTAEMAGERFDAIKQNTTDRLEEVTTRGRQRAERILGDAERKLEEKTHLVSKAQKQPLAALGIAFGAGFLLAGSDSGERKSQRMSKATNQLKGALMGGFSAAVSREIRQFIDEQGGASGLTSKIKSSLEAAGSEGAGKMQG